MKRLTEIFSLKTIKGSKLTMPSSPTVQPLKSEGDCKCPPDCSTKRKESKMSAQIKKSVSIIRVSQKCHSFHNFQKFKLQNYLQLCHFIQFEKGENALRFKI